MGIQNNLKIHESSCVSRQRSLELSFCIMLLHHFFWKKIGTTMALPLRGIFKNNLTLMNKGRNPTS